MHITCAALLWLSGRKTVSACQREVSLVLGISSGVDKKTDGTGEVRGPCYGWQVCLFGLSLISCFPPPRPSPTLPTVWPGSDHVGTDQGHFSPESQHNPPHSPLRPIQNTWGKFGRITSPWASNNNWLICTRILVHVLQREFQQKQTWLTPTVNVHFR